MAHEFTIETVNEPGTLAKIGHILGEAKVNIDGLQAYSIGESSIMHLVCDNHEAARAALDAGGINYTINEVLLVEVLNQPGMLGDVAMVMKNGDININHLYITMGGVMVLAVDDLAGANEVAGGMDVMRLRP